MSYKAKISKTANGVKEKKSVLFIEYLLVDAPAKTKIETEDTNANIDGYIELLDEDGYPKGKVTIQVKTVNKVDENKNRFPCPTSLFAHAEVTTDIVLLIAVDHSQNVALWKYISRSLLEENRSKEEQETITLHFGNEEKLSSSTLSTTLQTWRSISQREVKINQDASYLSAENEKLRQLILQSQNSTFKIAKEDVIKIQQFSDAYNHLLDSEFRYIKETIFPKCWKRGIAIYTFGDTELCYSLFNIKYGENSLLMKQLPETVMRYDKGDYSSCQYQSNDIKENHKLMAIKLVKTHVEKFIKERRIIPAYDEFILEYVRDFCVYSNRELNIDDSKLSDIPKLIEQIKHKYPRISSMPHTVLRGHKKIPINILYEGLLFLQNRGYTKIPSLYPNRGNYADSGLVSSWYTPELAFQKLQMVVTVAYSAYSDFINNNFPFLAKELDCYYGANIIVIDLEYTSDGWPCIYILFLKNQMPDNTKKIIFTKKESSPLLKENEVEEYSKLFQLPLVTYQGKQYVLFRGQGGDAHKYLFDRYNFLSVFYDVLEDRMQEYFKQITEN
ncbi:hypothetical protein M2137_001438 [Parabacteroides sp. PFB2-10]|uniref:DUF4365 domain-containing protein n=1 Tax=Parabacteroides sp. PFB2-10 TaxID=1742405 RepID=UPI0024738D5F|nr:DUF4365 domain-containing protein [Parabacteroides sp. PFB2-10]MDH6312663.1 hypothetical protein [Parabacteroides sp. PFB2-10]